MRVSDLLPEMAHRIVVDDNGCWVWQGATRAGYGASGQKLVHRISAERHFGPLPEDRQVHHQCFNKLCSNPEHLEVTTQSQNLRYSLEITAAEQTHCKWGHEFTEENTYRFGRDKRSRGCRTCRSARRQGIHPKDYVPVGRGKRRVS